MTEPVLDWPIPCDIDRFDGVRQAWLGKVITSGPARLPQLLDELRSLAHTGDSGYTCACTQPV